MNEYYDNALHMMEKQGGSFVQSLAHCYYMADPVNKAKLREAFSNYFDDYQMRFDRWYVNKPRKHCAGHERYASDCGACYHTATAAPTGEKT